MCDPGLKELCVLSLAMGTFGIGLLWDGNSDVIHIEVDALLGC